MANLTKSDWEMAFMSQGAVNVSGLVHSMNEVVTKIWEEAHRTGKGMDWVNQHPIVRLYAEQIHYLASKTDYSQAYEEVKRMAEGD